MPLDLFISLLLFPILACGLAWPLASRLALDPAEKLCATVVLSLLGVYLLAFASYGLGLPTAATRLIPVMAAAGLLAGWRALAPEFRDPDGRALLVSLALIATWCLGWLALVASYSGGGWAGDWYEHWERSRFFAERWPRDARFLGISVLPARPPLANLVTGVGLPFARPTFAGYQLVTTLLSCLVFLPAALLARRWGGRRAIGVVTVLLMLNPMFMENATFAWTKLIAGFFILSGLYFFLRAREASPPPAAAPLCAASLAAGVLAHYSAGPYVLLLAVAWLGLGRPRWREPAFWRQTVQLGLIGGLILATWFGWSLAVYGQDATFLSNTSVTVREAREGNQAVKIARNLRNTLVPHFLRHVDPQLIAQRSAWSHARDWFFQLYQVNLLFAFGSVAWLAVAARLVRDARSAAAGTRRFWIWFAGGAVILGVAVHGARDEWGLAHICLQALVVLGLAYLAARWAELGRGWQRILVAGAAVDFSLGIALQFAAESQTPDLAMILGRVPPGLPIYNENAVMNLAGKVQHGIAFFGDAVAVPVPVILLLLATLLLLALRRGRPAAA